jgi:hypothetical protein
MCIHPKSCQSMSCMAKKTSLVLLVATEEEALNPTWPHALFVLLLVTSAATLCTTLCSMVAGAKHRQGVLAALSVLRESCALRPSFCSALVGPISPRKRDPTHFPTRLQQQSLKSRFLWPPCKKLLMWDTRSKQRRSVLTEPGFRFLIR